MSTQLTDKDIIIKLLTEMNELKDRLSRTEIELQRAKDNAPPHIQDELAHPQVRLSRDPNVSITDLMRSKMDSENDLSVELSNQLDKTVDLLIKYGKIKGF